MIHNVEEIRTFFPALSRLQDNESVVYFDGPGGTQVVKNVIGAMVRYMETGSANRSGAFLTSRETELHIQKAREAISDLVGCNPNEVAFGQNATSLIFQISQIIGENWSTKDNIVLTEIDHHANIDPWRLIAEKKGVEVRYIPLDSETLTLDYTNLDNLIDENTKLVAVTKASNVIGSVIDIEPIVSKAKKVQALVTVDAVQAVPHMAIDFKEMGVDFLFFSTYKFYGPHLGVAIIHEEVYRELNVLKLAPAPSTIPDKLETGTQNHEAIASIDALVEFISSLGTGDTRRERIRSAYTFMSKHENYITERISNYLKGIPEVTLYQPLKGAFTPTIAFTIKGVQPEEFSKWLSDNYSIFLANGDFYASTLARKLNLDKNGGWIRIGISLYNTEEEVDLFVKAMEEFLSRKKITV